MARTSIISWLVAIILGLPDQAQAQRKAQNYALSTFFVNGSAFIPVPACSGDSTCYAVLMNDALWSVLKERKTFTPLGYRRYVRSRLRRDRPIPFSAQEAKDHIESLASNALVEHYRSLDQDSLLKASFDTRGLLVSEEEAPEGAAIITALFTHGNIVSMDDESGVAYLDTGWKSDPPEDTHRID